MFVISRLYSRFTIADILTSRMPVTRYLSRPFSIDECVLCPLLTYLDTLQDPT
jgi:hypothetical protein